MTQPTVQRVPKLHERPSFTFIQFNLDFFGNSSISRLPEDSRGIGAIPKQMQQQFLDCFWYRLFLGTELRQRNPEKPGTERTLGVSKHGPMNHKL